MRWIVGDPTQYAHCLIKPAGQIDDLPAIVNEKANIDRIVATLGLKEMTQGTLVRKLCTYDADPTRDPRLQRFVHRSQNRIESYHQLRSAIAQVAGKKELTGRTDLDIEISNQVRQVDRQCDRVLQLRDPVAPADHVQGQRERGGAGAHHINITRGLAACALEWALRVQRRRASHRSGHHHPGAESIAAARREARAES